ncbi:MAG: 16S rRNA (cytosine(967)-C(5))-methyltransferase RsmB [Gammaproteobacteria bacterium]|nr:16S rRNA (cytosine(967)-C(5))-methyltransferase RsmB [Gammaproteobacteria bacterium]
MEGAASRARAARILGDVLAGTPLPEAFGRHGGDPVDTAFVRELAWGAARMAPRLEHQVRAHLARPPRSRDLDIHALLLIGAYQLGWTNVPTHACVHATVAATSVLGKDWARGLVNAVMRRLSEQDLQDDRDLPEAARLCHPDWLLAELRAAWPDEADAIIAAGDARPPMTLRCRDDRDAALVRLAQAGLDARPGELCERSIRLDQPVDVSAIPGFDEGAFSVQDEGAQLAAELLDARPGDRVLDACAAPGGKTLHIAQRTPEAEITALDVDGRRCRRIRENLERAGVTARVLEGDARTPDAAVAEGGYDRILVDAPCSATGILRRQPDVRILRRQGDVAKLAGVQLELLEALWPLLRPGGRLVYCTCSVLPREGPMVVEAFLDRHRDALVRPIAADRGILRGPGRQLLPTVDAHDGFFYSCLERNTDTGA